jgi:hypothetical protein
LVRVRISNVQSGDVANNPYCEFRIASAEAFETAARVSFEQVRKSVLTFFDTQFGADHWFHIATIHARMIMREPLGVLAAMEGTSDLFERTGNLGGPILKFVTDERSLSQV